jgi:hypothetical protein
MIEVLKEKEPTISFKREAPHCRSEQAGGSDIMGYHSKIVNRIYYL